jgi:hypothetical protein
MENGSRQGAVWEWVQPPFTGKGDEEEKKAVRVVALKPLRSHAFGIIIAQRATTTKPKQKKPKTKKRPEGKYSHKRVTKTSRRGMSSPLRR